jgi:hypothetical protein
MDLRRCCGSRGRPAPRCAVCRVAVFYSLVVVLLATQSYLMYTPFGSFGKSCMSFGAVRPGIRYVLARGFFADDPPKLSETLRLSCRAAFSLCCSRKRMSSRFDLSVVMIRFGGGAVSLVGMYSGGALRATMTRVRPAPPEPWQRPLLGRSANRLAIVHSLQDGETYGRVGVCQRLD